MDDASVLRVYDGAGSILSDTQNGQRKILFSTLDEVPVFIRSGLLYREDRNFWKHWGVDWFAIARAMRENMRVGRFVQ